MSLLRFVVPALAIARSALAASCSVAKTTTLQNAGDASALAACRTFSGSIALATNAADEVDLSGIEKLTGDLYVNNAPNLTALTGSSLANIEGRFYLNNVPQLTTLTFPALTDVDTIYWNSLANLYGWTLTEGIQSASSVWLSDTKVNTLTGLNLLTVENININNNNLLQNISMQLNNITGALVVSQNGGMPTVSFPDLLYAVNMTLVGVSNLSLDKLKQVNQTLGIYESSVQELSFPKLTTVGGLAIVNNDKLSSLSAPALATVNGPLSVVNDTGLTGSISFPKVSQVKGAVQVIGSFNNVQLPMITNVAGAFDLESTKDIDKVCNHFSAIAGSNDVINGAFTCSGTSPQATAGSGTSSGSSSSSTHTGAARRIDGSTQAIGGVLGVFLAILGML